MWLPWVKPPKTLLALRWSYAVCHLGLWAPPWHHPLFLLAQPVLSSPKLLTSILMGLSNRYSGPPPQPQCLSLSTAPQEETAVCGFGCSTPHQSRRPTQIGGCRLSHAWANCHFLTGTTMHNHAQWHPHLSPDQSLTIPTSCVDGSDHGQCCLHSMVWDSL